VAIQIILDAFGDFSYLRDWGKMGPNKAWVSAPQQEGKVRLGFILFQ